MKIYKLERMICFIPYWATAFICVVTFVKSFKHKVSLINWGKYLLIIIGLFICQSLLLDVIFPDISPLWETLLLIPVDIIFNLILIAWQESTFE